MRKRRPIYKFKILVISLDIEVTVKRTMARKKIIVSIGRTFKRTFKIIYSIISSY